MAEIIDPTAMLEKIGGFSPLWRVLLATAGTLQGTLSAYFGAPVTVEVVSQDDNGPLIRRKVNLVCRDRGLVVCTATTDVMVDDPEIRRIIDEREVGLGQILEQLKVKASFELEDVGRGAGVFWRRYRLTGDGFTYTIREEFPMILYADVHSDGA